MGPLGLGTACEIYSIRLVFQVSFLILNPLYLSLDNFFVDRKPIYIMICIENPSLNLSIKSCWDENRKSHNRFRVVRKGYQSNSIKYFGCVNKNLSTLLHNLLNMNSHLSAGISWYTVSLASSFHSRMTNLRIFIILSVARSLLH